MQQLIEDIVSLSVDIRYVAVYLNGELMTVSRPGAAAASSSESDKYEELIVNPTLLTLVKQRGDIDCGGLRHVLVRYGNFYQLVMPIRNGHISICIEPVADPLRLVEPVQSELTRHGLP
jgi:hypothetical protein